MCDYDGGGVEVSSTNNSHSPVYQDFHQSHLSYDLSDMEASPTDNNEDIYSQLAQKERDLILAAELGKALLEKNQELTKKNESLSEEYNQKFEELTQEKHELRLRLEAVEQEYDMTVRELQHDVTTLRHELDISEEQARATERAKNQVIHELSQQNERLTEQVKKASYCEEQLQTQVAGMREQVTARRSSMHAHVQQLSLLREEINLLTERKAELERRLASLTEERDQGRSDLEEAQDRIMMLEKQKLEHEYKLRSQEREINELQERAGHLHHKVETLSLQASNSTLEHSTNSLFSELEMSQNLPHSMSTDSLDNSLRAEIETPFPKTTASAPRPNKLLLPAISFPTPPLCEDDIECDDDEEVEQGDVAGAASLSPQSLHDMQYLAGFRSPDEDWNCIQLKQEIVDAYQEVQQMLQEARSKTESVKELPPNESTPASGSLHSVLTELRELMQIIVKKEIAKSSPESSGERDSSVLTSPVIAIEGSVRQEVHDELEAQMKELQEELATTQEQMSRLRADLDLKDNELRQKSGELQKLTNKLSLQHQELQALQAERDRLQDQSAGITRDEIVEQARAERNKAIQNRNSMEVELAQAKLDLMSLDSQLMEAIQQKVALSQQLEQWQDDMQELIGIQMAKRIKSEDKVEETLSKENSPAQARRRKPFWS